MFKLYVILMKLLFYYFTQKNMLFNIAVVGATGLVGRELINTLYDRKFPIDKLIPFASKKSHGKSVS